jgi:hypothetical protein
MTVIALVQNYENRISKWRLGPSAEKNASILT